MAEGYRLLKQKNLTNSLWRSLNKVSFSSFSNKEQFFYVKYYSRYFANKRKYQKAISLLKKYAFGLPHKQHKKRDELLVELGTKFLRKDRYEEIVSLIPGFSNNSKVALIRMQALRKVDNVPLNQKEKEAAHYLKNHDADSAITERTFFTACLKRITDKKISQAKICLEKLAFINKKHVYRGQIKIFFS